MYKKKVMKPQNKKDRLNEAEGKKKGMKKNKQNVKDRLDEAEGKKKGSKLTPAQKKLPVKLKNAIKKKK